jgi:hypothetical protein
MTQKTHHTATTPTAGHLNSEHQILELLPMSDEQSRKRLEKKVSHCVKQRTGYNLHTLRNQLEPTFNALYGHNVNALAEHAAQNPTDVGNLLNEVKFASFLCLVQVAQKLQHRVVLVAQQMGRNVTGTARLTVTLDAEHLDEMLSHYQRCIFMLSLDPNQYAGYQPRSWSSTNVADFFTFAANHGQRLSVEFEQVNE